MNPCPDENDAAGMMRALLPLHAVAAHLVRPTHSGHDLAVPLAKLQLGRYGAELKPPLPGQWDIRVEAEHDGGTYQATRRVMIR